MPASVPMAIGMPASATRFRFAAAMRLAVGGALGAGGERPLGVHRLGASFGGLGDPGAGRGVDAAVGVVDRRRPSAGGAASNIRT